MAYELPSLVSSVYLPRLIGFLLAVLVTAAGKGPELFSSGLGLVLMVVCLMYPHIAYVVQRRFFIGSNQVCASMLMDSVLVGLLIVYHDFYWFTALAFTAFLLLSTAIIGELVWVFRVAMVLLLVLLCGFWLDPASPVAGNLLIDAATSIAILIFVSFVSWRVFHITRAVELARRSAVSEQRLLQNRSENLSRFLGQELIESLASQATAPQRRWLTICFTDLCGFTALMDELPEHVMTERLNRYLDEMAIIVHKHRGTLDKFMGDGLLVFFGDPETKGHRQDALACIKMALEMRDKLQDLACAWDLPLHMRVGVHSGYCTVGGFGSRSRMDYTVIGSTVNIASRLESNARVGSILISSSTARLVSDVVELKPSAQYQLKGVAKPLQCQEVICARDAHHSFGRQPSRLQLLR